MSQSEDRARFLAAYDENLRTDAETPSALKVTRHGPLRLVTFMKGRGFVTYKDLGDADAPTVKRLVAETVAYYVAEPEITRVEWNVGMTTPRVCTRRYSTTASPKTIPSQS